MFCGVRVRFARGVLVLAGLSLCVAACTSKPDPESLSNSSGAPSKAASTEGESTTGQRGLRIRPNVDTFAGRWGLVLLQPVPDKEGQQSLRDLCVALLEFAGDPAAPTATILATLPGMPDTKLANPRISENRITFEFGTEPQLGDFDGALVDGVVRGSLNLPGQGVLAATLRPTEETSYEGWDPAPLAAGRPIFTDAAKSKDQPNAILNAVKEMKGSSLSLKAFEGLLGRLGQYPQLDEAAIRDICELQIATAAPWGSRIVDQAKVHLTVAVTMTRRFPDLALELAAEAEKIDPKYLPNVAELLKFVREQALIDQALAQLKSDKPEVRDPAFAKLQELLPTQRYNPEILEALGTYASKNGQADLAIEYFSDVIALPLLESMLANGRNGQPPGDPNVREQLLTLWETKHGSVDGFDSHLKAVYAQRLSELSAKSLAAAPQVVEPADRKRTVLVELFTGVTCPPCVAADVGTAILNEAYPPSDVVVLRFHQHIPGPDPLANQDSEDRFSYYEGRGTPTVIVDGIVNAEQGVPGPLHSAENAYKTLRGMVDQRLKVAAACELTLSAEVRDGELIVSAAGSAIPEEGAGNFRMRLALVENALEFQAANGIREHHFLVRELLGGVKGTTARDGMFEYSLQMPLADIEQNLTDYLQQFEAGRSVEFPIKPTQLKGLSLVGWVQNDATREVLQTKIIPVMGTDATAEEMPNAEGAPKAADAPASAAEPVNATDPVSTDPVSKGS